MNPIQNNLTNALDIGNLPIEEQQEIILSVGNLIYQNVLMRVMETMPEPDQDEFEGLLDRNGSPQEIFGFLKNKVPEFEKIIEEEAVKFKDQTSSIMNQIN